MSCNINTDGEDNKTITLEDTTSDNDDIFEIIR